MGIRKKTRDSGKIKLSRYFQEIKTGDRVAVVIERGVQWSFPKRLQGRSGVIEEKRGDAYLVKIKDQNQEKRFLVEPIHLKKLE
ncbi:MAG: 50S ribosomal protein L21e [Nanoarchaeota archaeon]|nr:50S ribosomal protein L21e [Nanoarchaeota archaeon]